MSKYLPLNLFIRQALLYPLTFPFLPPVDKVEEGHKYAAGRLIGTLEVGTPYGLPKTGQTTSYRDGDDGDLEIGKPDAPPRFIDNEDGTITCAATGLMWVKDPGAIGGIWGSAGDPNRMVWNDAIDNCLALDYAGHQDWRLPNIIELVSIVHFGKAVGPMIDTDFFVCEDYYYQSSTTRAEATIQAWHVYFATCEVIKLSKTVEDEVRPVRGPI